MSFLFDFYFYSRYLNGNIITSEIGDSCLIYDYQPYSVIIFESDIIFMGHYPLISFYFDSPKMEKSLALLWELWGLFYRYPAFLIFFLLFYKKSPANAIYGCFLNLYGLRKNTNIGIPCVEYWQKNYAHFQLDGTQRKYSWKNKGGF